MTFLLFEILGEVPRVDSVADARSAGENWVVIGVKEGKFYAYANGKRWGPYDFAKILGVGKHFWAFGGFKGSEATAVVNGKELGLFTGICCAFEAGRTWILLGKEKGGKVAYVNGERLGPFSNLWGPVVKGEHWAFWFNEGRAKALLVDGRRYGPYNEITPPKFVGGKPLFTAILEGDYFIVWGDTALGPFKGITKIEAQGNTWSASVRKEDGFYAVVNGKTKGPYAYCWLRGGVFTVVEKGKRMKIKRLNPEEF